jgi:iron complex transport system ATP-binding protein
MIPYLDVRNAEVFQGNKRVFEQLNLQLFTGQNTAILGPNGAGKSTFIKLLSRELYPVVKPESHVKICGNTRVLLSELRAQIGLVSQSLQNQYNGHATALEVVLSGFFGSIGLHSHQTITQEQRQKALASLERVGMAGAQSDFYQHLSSGQQRRLLLARAMIHQPAILILDEPTNGLDIGAALQLRDQLRHLAQTGTSLLIVSHQLEDLIPEVERVILLKNAQILADGTADAILNNALLSQLYDYPLQLHRVNQQLSAIAADSPINGAPQPAP